MDYFGKLAFFVALVYITRAFGNDLGDINQKRKNEAAHEGICLENAPSNNIDEVTLMDDLKTNFQVTHFGVAGRCNLHLCHRVSAESIDCMIEGIDRRKDESKPRNGRTDPGIYADRCQGYDDKFICQFLTQLAKFDQDAYVNYGPWYPPLTKWGTSHTGDDFWKQLQPARKFYKKINGQMDPASYITQWLENKNEKYLSDALGCLNKEGYPRDPKCWTTITTLAKAFPANLRYGDSSSNESIQKNFDPMGDKDGKLTTDEQAWTRGALFQEGCIEYNPEIVNNVYQIPSSTGRPESEREFVDQYGKFKVRWYIQCIPNTANCRYE